MRNVERTKQRLLDAATVEFAELGLAGARIDRIAEEAGVSKALIYTYFGNKEQLFDAVLDATISRVAHDVGFDITDLPGYAARRFDWHLAHPEIPRLMTWAKLERGSIDKLPALALASARKRAAITEAQHAGLISTHFSPDAILAVISALSMLGFPAGDHADEAAIASAERDRKTVIETLRLMTEPIHQTPENDHATRGNVRS
jgi:AcrR family transcriptional regulator